MPTKKRKATTAVTVSKAEAKAMKEELFANAYLANGCNAADAYRAAGYKPSNTNVAKVEGHRMLQSERVQTIIEARRAEALAASKLTADEVLQSLAKAVRFDPRKLFNEDGSLKSIHQLDADTADALETFEVVEIANSGEGQDGGSGSGEGKKVRAVTAKVKWLNKNVARDQAMRHFGHFEVDNRQRAPASVAIGQLTIGLDFSKVRARARTLQHGE